MTMIGRVFEGFEVVEKIGEGGMGVVYRATDTSLGRVVALKMLHSELTKDPQLTERFLSEARTQAQLNHPNLATLYRLFQFEGSYFMVMEFVNGETFAQMVRREGPIPQERAIPLFIQALAGLSHAHHAGIIHRDIKPSNMMVNKDQIVKVMDFGIAKILGGRGLTATGVRLGTLYYMSPEQIRNQQLDIRTDIYALGITLYEMLTGRVPFDSNSDYELMQQHIQQTPPPPRQFFPYLSQGLEYAIMQALEKDPARRFQTVEAFSRALGEASRAATRATLVVGPTPVSQAATMVAQPYTPGRTPLPAGGGTPVPTPSSTPIPLGATVVSSTPLPSTTPVPPLPPFAPTTPPPGVFPHPTPPGGSWIPSTPVPATPYSPETDLAAAVTSPPNKLVPLILGAVAVVVVLIVIVGFVVKTLRNRPQPEQTASAVTSGAPKMTQPQAPVTTPGSQTIPTPAPVETQPPPPTVQEPAPTTTSPSSKVETSSKAKERKKTQKGQISTSGSSKPAELPSAAQQALVQQQIEAERQRMLQQQQMAQQQKEAAQAPPLAPQPSTQAKPAGLSYRVAHLHGGDQRCVGTLTISKTHVGFKAESGPHSFNVAVDDVKELKKNGPFSAKYSFHIKLKTGDNYNLVRMSVDNHIQPADEIMVQANEVLPASVKR
jgi:serine/threonine-protein kinase